nr:opticin isoform X4 [Peromyscus maniculatus bairdii]
MTQRSRHQLCVGTFGAPDPHPLLSRSLFPYLCMEDARCHALQDPSLARSFCSLSLLLILMCELGHRGFQRPQLSPSQAQTDLMVYFVLCLQAKVDSLTLPTRTSPSQSTVVPKMPSSNLTVPRPTTTGLPNVQGSHGLPTCLVCVCLGSSVYCDDADLENIPPLPRMTTYLYARFNHISHIQAGDFKGLTKLKRIDLSSNSISSIHNDAFRLLPALQDLILPENQLAALPVLPSGLEFLDVRLNRLQSSGIQPEAFVALERLQFLYLADNLLDSIPGPLPLSLCSLHLQLYLRLILQLHGRPSVSAVPSRIT